ncbi:MAG: hypothetical protein J2P36_15595 [Ktedonobacteraceae bacterium]|nr:hypothetical protein [Ktedonobacteraceae bacterium]
MTKSCPMCHKNIGYNARRCSKCGGEVRRHENWTGIIAMFSMLCVIGGVVTGTWWVVPVGIVSFLVYLVVK